MTTSAARAAIIQAAQEAGEDPAYALAIAERESNFNPLAHNSVTIHGMYQMTGDLRRKYGAGDSNDPLDQARGWMRSLPDIRARMKQVLGRDPTNEEVYLGHHYGAARAARTLNMDPSTPTWAVFTPQEMQDNPHFARAGTIGNLNASIMADVDKRMARFGGESSAPSEPADLSSYGEAVEPADLSSFGDAVGSSPSPSVAAAGASQGAKNSVAAEPADLSSYGTPVS